MIRGAAPEVLRFEDAEAVALAAAEAFAQACHRAVEARAVFRVALSGGSTPRRIHSLLCLPPLRDEIGWDRVEIFWGDERSVPPGDPESNYRMARETLLDEIRIDEERVHRMPAEREDLVAAARDYQDEIARSFGARSEGRPPRFDLILLGMGEDGHTASLFPGTDALAERKRWVVANEVPQLETSRMTLTYPLINAARDIVFVVTGDAKAKMLARVIEGPGEIESLPSRGVQPEEGGLRYLVDAAAASRLSGRPSSGDAQPIGGEPVT